VRDWAESLLSLLLFFFPHSNVREFNWRRDHCCSFIDPPVRTQWYSFVFFFSSSWRTSRGEGVERESWYVVHAVQFWSCFCHSFCLSHGKCTGLNAEMRLGTKYLKDNILLDVTWKRLHVQTVRRRGRETYSGFCERFYLSSLRMKASPNDDRSISKHNRKLRKSLSVHVLSNSADSLMWQTVAYGIEPSSGRWQKSGKLRVLSTQDKKHFLEDDYSIKDISSFKIWRTFRRWQICIELLSARRERLEPD